MVLTIHCWLDGARYGGGLKDGVQHGASTYRNKNGEIKRGE